jgi:type I restriction enzyme R subunit
VHDDDQRGRVKLVFTGSAADRPEIRRFVRTPQALSDLKLRAQRDDSVDPLDLVIVVDLWLTGFDAPSLTTMYLAKPMRGHTLFQAVTRPNRVWRDKPAGLVVSYVPIADELNAAIRTFTSSGQQPAVGVSIDEAVRALREKHEVVVAMLHGHSWLGAASETERFERAELTAQFVLTSDDLTIRFMDQTLALAKAFAIAGATDAGRRLRGDVEFLLAVRGLISKLRSETSLTSPAGADLQSVIKSVVEGAIEADDIIDVYAEGGVERPEISLLSEDFLRRVDQRPNRNFQIEVLRKILADGIHAVVGRNVVRSRTLSETLRTAIQRYHNKTLSDAEVVAELVQLARTLRGEETRAAATGLSPSELAFYDAVASNASAVDVLGDDELRLIAREVAERIRGNVSLDWRDRESVRAKMRLIVKTTLRNHRYPPDKQEEATELVLEQARLFTDGLLSGSMS